MKKKKLNLNKLKVQSFVTDLNQSNAETIKGGILSIIFCCGDDGHSNTCPPINTQQQACITLPPCLPTSTVSTHNEE